MNDTFTFNMLKTFAECPKKYEFLYEKKLRLPQHTAGTQTGNNIHNLINYHLKGQNTSKLQTLLNEVEQKLWKNYCSLNLNDCLASEYTFFLKFENAWLTGRIDALLQTDDGYLIADWKTGNFKHDEKEQFQTYFYLFSMFNILSRKNLIYSYSDLSMKYFILTDESQILVKLNERLYNNIHGRLKKLLGEIYKERFLCHFGEQCKSCPYKSFCNN